MFNLIESFIIDETIGSSKADLLKKVQHEMFEKFHINASLRGWMNFFSNDYHLKTEDDDTIISKIQKEGYRINGDWEDNKKFWEGILTKEEYETLTSIVETIVENIYDITISEKDYKQWLKVIVGHAEDNNINLMNRYKFYDVAHNVLDNDSKIDLIHPTEKTRKHIVSTLWKLHSAKKDVENTDEKHQQHQNEQHKNNMKKSYYDEGKRAFHKHFKEYSLRDFAANEILRLPHPESPYSEHSDAYDEWHRGFSDEGKKYAKAFTRSSKRKK